MVQVYFSEMFIACKHIFSAFRVYCGWPPSEMIVGKPSGVSRTEDCAGKTGAMAMASCHSQG